MKIALRQISKGRGERRLRLGIGIQPGDAVIPRGYGDILVGTSDPAGDAYELSLMAAFSGALGSAWRDGTRDLCIDVNSFAPKGESCDYFANAILDTLCEWRQMAGDPDLNVCLECDLVGDVDILEQVEEELEKPVIVKIMQAYGTPSIEERVARYLLEHPAEKEFRVRLNDIIRTRYDGKNSIVYKRAGISRSVYSKTMSPSLDYLPSKPTVMALAIGLRLGLEEAQSLFHAAGYHLGDVELLDRIVRFFLEEGIYDIHEVNSTLYAYRLPLLGEHMREVGVIPEND